MNTSQKSALATKKANSVLGCIKQGIASRVRKGDLSPLLSTGESSPGVLGPLLVRDTDLLERVLQRATKMMKRQKHLFFEERPRDLGLFSLEKRKLWGPHQCIKILEGRVQRRRSQAVFKRQWAHTGTQKAPSKDQETLLYG